MNITRKRITELRAQIQTALDALGLEDVKMTVGNGTYGETGSFKLEIASIGADGNAITKEASDWPWYAPMHECKAEWLNESFTSDRGDTHRIIGWASRAKKNPVRTEFAGKTYSWPIAAIKHYMEAQRCGAPE